MGWEIVEAHGGEVRVLDFVDGLVLHLTSGAAALAAAIVLGPRKGYGKESFMPHNLPMTLMGTGLLWFGWFGLTAGQLWRQTA